MKTTFIYILTVFVAAYTGFTLHRYLDHQQQQNNPAIGSMRPEFTAMDLNHQPRNIREWDGKIIFVNFWATWCPPCLKEIPDFIDLQNSYGDQDFQIIGIAIDGREEVEKFAVENGVNYPLMAVEMDGIELARKFGNDSGGLPFTAVINRKGEIHYTITGELRKKQAVKLLKELGIN